MTPTTFCLLLLFTGGAQGASIVLRRPKGNSRPRPRPPLADPAPNLKTGDGEGDTGSGFGEVVVRDIDLTSTRLFEDLRVSEAPVVGQICSYEALVDALKLGRSERFQTVRPVKNHTASLRVYLEVVLYAILDVRETDQTCVTCVWTFMSWINENIMWDPEKYCGMDKITIPSDSLWKPDIIIKEV